ncbi:MAG: hypothetical protein FJ267_20205, partial [Planctomycetes bacterium]|nr:hypothetical protein [Planctomycetota bacterium]
MYYGLLALLTRSLRQDAKQFRNHMFRLAFVGFIYTSLLFATFTSSMFGAPGLRFFTTIAYLNLFFISCAGIGYFSTAITEEKEEETIGLLQMAGLNPLGILFGKSTSRLIQAMLLLIVQFPFSLLAVTLGGVTPHQIVSAYVALVAYMILLANVALLFSTICDRSGLASVLTGFVFAGYFLAPYWTASLSTLLISYGWSSTQGYQGQLNSILMKLGNISVFDRLRATTETGFHDAAISHQVVSNIVGGMICFLLAWVLFHPFTKSYSTHGVQRGIVLKSSGRIAVLSPGRCWKWPLVW